MVILPVLATLGDQLLSAAGVLTRLTDLRGGLPPLLRKVFT